MLKHPQDFEPRWLAPEEVSQVVAHGIASALGEEKEAKTWGMSVRDVTRRYANERQLDDDGGVWITTLSNGYPAGKAEMHVGDVVRSINNKPVKDVDEFVKLYEASIKAKDEKVYLVVQRDRGRQYFVLKVSY